MKVASRSKWLLWLVLVLPIYAPVVSAELFDNAELKSQFSAPAAITLEQAAEMVRRDTGGRVLSATPSEQGGRRGYDIRVLLDGKRVKKVFVDARGGRRGDERP